MTNVKMTVIAASACNPLPVYKNSCPLIVRGVESVFGEKSVPLPEPPPPCPLLVARMQNKLSFPLNLPLYWLLNSEQPEPTFSYKILIKIRGEDYVAKGFRKHFKPTLKTSTQIGAK